MADNLSDEIIKSFISEQRSNKRWKNVRTFLWVFLVLLFIAILFAPAAKNVGSVPTKP